MKTLQQSVKNLEELFDIFNEKLYGCELEKPIISIQSDKTTRAYGWCTTYKAWETTDGETYYEINMCAEYMTRSFEEICGTLIHEMAHLYNLLNELKDCDASQYHNKKFKEAAEAHGLVVEKTNKGWSKTTLNEEMKEFIGTLDYTFDIARKIQPKRITAKKKTSLKYQCPCCGAKLYSVYVLDITCNECDEIFIQY
jgi:hypothetical protein